MVLYIDKKHIMDVLTIICVGSMRKAPLLRFTCARSIPWTYVSLYAGCADGRHWQCLLPRREAPIERIWRYLCGVRTKGPSMLFDIGNKHTMYVLIVVCVGSVRKAPALRAI